MVEWLITHPWILFIAPVAVLTFIERTSVKVPPE